MIKSLLLNRLFKSNPALFWLWFKLYRSRKGVRIKWFNKETLFIFDGYPRSGNTYLFHLLKEIYSETQMVHHFHTVASIKIAKQKRIKILILIREPLESISSNY